jgi:energy-coupling factor transporter ATP-binding protein EcfA2
MREVAHFTRVDFNRFKAFQSFTLHLRHMNILVGPNNSGKSTILAAFRILAAAMRKASRRKAEMVDGPEGQALGYEVDLRAISVAEENICHNYDDSAPATVRFKLSNGNSLLLYFPGNSRCRLLTSSQKQSTTPNTFNSAFNCAIGFVAILGPVEHDEHLYQKEAAQSALYNYRAARNFRNIWYHYRDEFPQFRRLLGDTWPGMDIQRTEVEASGQGPRLYMFCQEERISREICWAGFGFHVWCQMLTHLVQSSGKGLFLIDEPDIYLHSDLQRHLLSVLRNRGPDILIATHSTEIITEADADDIVVIDKKRKSAHRLSSSEQLGGVFALLGSRLNPTLTQLAKTRRAVFVEGEDFKIIARFAQKCNAMEVATRANFAVLPVEGFNPQKIRNLRIGIEETLGAKITGAAILDRDFRCDEECAAIASECRGFCECVVIHRRKEIENFLLVPDAIDRAAARKAADRAKRSGERAEYSCNAHAILDAFAEGQRGPVTARHLSDRTKFERGRDARIHATTINEAGLAEVNRYWETFESRIAAIPGKEALSAINQELQIRDKISLTPTAIIDAMLDQEIPAEMHELLEALDEFAKKPLTL